MDSFIWWRSNVKYISLEIWIALYGGVVTLKYISLEIWIALYGGVVTLSIFLLKYG